MTDDAAAIRENLARLRDRIAAACARAGRAPETVALVAVSKTKPAEALEAALAAGVATGLQFAPTTREALELALGRLGVLWRDRDTWARLQRNAMSADVGWSRPARQYAALYRAIMR